MRYSVGVEKYMRCTGRIAVLAESEDEALDIAADSIDTGVLQTTDVPWGESEYEDLSFSTTGEIEESGDDISTSIDPGEWERLVDAVADSVRVKLRDEGWTAEGSAAE